MAENKKSFILYADLIHVVKKLVLQDRINKTNLAGELFLHVLEYVNDENPVPIDFIVDMAFEPIKQQLKRDLEKWDGEIIKKGENGFIGNLKRWHPDLYDRVIEKTLSIHDAYRIVSERKLWKSSHPDSTQSDPIANIAVNDTVTVTVNDTVIKEVSTNVDTVDSLEKKYNALEKTGKKIGEFISIEKPTFYLPYFDLWNSFAKKNGCAEIKTLSDSRKRKLKVRIGEKNFDFVAILTAASKQKFALESRWFNFDFIIENDNNYEKVLEMKYVSETKATVAEPGLKKL